jgi:hypothetical protein
MQLNILFAILGLCAAVQETSTSSNALSGPLSRAPRTLSQATAFSEDDPIVTMDGMSDHMSAWPQLIVSCITGLISLYNVAKSVKRMPNYHFDITEENRSSWLSAAFGILVYLAYVIDIVLYVKFIWMNESWQTSYECFRVMFSGFPIFWNWVYFFAQIASFMGALYFKAAKGEVDRVVQWLIVGLLGFTVAFQLIVFYYHVNRRERCLSEIGEAQIDQ